MQTWCSFNLKRKILQCAFPEDKNILLQGLAQEPKSENSCSSKAINLSYDFIHIINCPTNVFFNKGGGLFKGLRIRPRTRTVHLVVISLVSFTVEQFFSLSLCFKAWIFFNNMSQLFCRLSIWKRLIFNSTFLLLLHRNEPPEWNVIYIDKGAKHHKGKNL